MIKVIIRSVQPQHLFNILNGRKILEIGKSVPKDFKGWVYLYCTYGTLLHSFNCIHAEGRGYCLCDSAITTKANMNLHSWALNGKIVARFWFDEYEEFETDLLGMMRLEEKDIYKKSCLTPKEIVNYAKGKRIYAWKIKQLEVFDKPMELGDFRKIKECCKKSSCHNWEFNDYESSHGYCCLDYCPIEKAPQSWQYAYLTE